MSFEETHMVEKATENAYNYGVGVRNGFHADSPAVTFLHYTYKHEWKKKLVQKVTKVKGMIYICHSQMHQKVKRTTQTAYVWYFI